jgi:ADP-ribose pyrophosphatase
MLVGPAGGAAGRSEPMSEGPDKQVLAAGRYVRLVRQGRWEYVERVNVTGIVVMVPITDDGKLVLVEQHRVPARGRVIELPAGLVGDEPGRRHEPLADAAARELTEETGYRAAELLPAARGTPSAGLAGEVADVYVARGLRKVGPGGGDASEEITVHEVPLGEVPGWLAARAAGGTLIDLKVYAGLFLAQAAGG